MPTPAAICILEYRGAIDLDFRELGGNFAGRGLDPIVLASCSSSAMREALIPGRPISRIIVIFSPERRTLAVMLSVERLNDIEWKPIVRAISSIHSRVRAAVLPARIIKAPNNSSASTASPDAMEFLWASFSEVEAIWILSSIYAARTVAWRTHQWQAGRASIGRSKHSCAHPTRVLTQIKRTGFQYGILKAHTGDTPIALYPDTLLSQVLGLDLPTGGHPCRTLGDHCNFCGYSGDHALCCYGDGISAVWGKFRSLSDRGLRTNAVTSPVNWKPKTGRGMN